MYYSERNLRDMEKNSGDQILLKVSKEHFYIARIKFWRKLKTIGNRHLFSEFGIFVEFQYLWVKIACQV